MFQFLINWIWNIFVFFLGAITTISVILYYITQVLTSVEDKMIQSKNNELARFQTERDQLNKERESRQDKTAPKPEQHMKEHKTSLKLVTNPSNEHRELELKLKKWEFGVLRNNMLFLFENEQAAVFSSVILLDGAEVTATHMKEKKNRPKWNVPNELVLKHSQRDLVPGHKTCFISFKTRREFEWWYFLFLRAANLSTAKKDSTTALQNEFFRSLTSQLTNFNSDVNPHWITDIHNKEAFIDFVTKKINKKISKVKLPSFVERIDVVRVYFGPQMPLVKHVQLISVSEEGEVKLDADIVHNGEFNVTLRIHFLIGVPKLNKPFKFPAVLAVTVTHVAGKVHVHFSPPPSTRLWYGFYTEPEVALSINTEIGGKSKLRNLPKLANIIVYAIKSEIISLMVLPLMDDIPLPAIKAESTEMKQEVTTEEMISEEVQEQIDKIANGEKKTPKSEENRRSKDKMV